MLLTSKHDIHNKSDKKYRLSLSTVESQKIPNNFAQILPRKCVLLQLSEAIGGGRKVLLEAVLSVGGNQDGGGGGETNLPTFIAQLPSF